MPWYVRGDLDSLALPLIAHRANEKQSETVQAEAAASPFCQPIQLSRYNPLREITCPELHREYSAGGIF
ncbi:MAG: hypothetical protein HRF47_13740 [Chloroflexota bacterium]